MEQDFLVGYHDSAGKQRILSRIFGKLREQVLPSIPYFESYIQTLHRRDVSAHSELNRTNQRLFSKAGSWTVALAKIGADPCGTQRGFFFTPKLQKNPN